MHRNIVEGSVWWQIQVKNLAGSLQRMQGFGWRRNVDCRGAMLLGQLFTVISHDQRGVHVNRAGQRQRMLQNHLTRGVVGQIGTAHHVADALRRVVHNHRQLIRPQTICTPNDEVTHLKGDILLLWAEPAVTPVPCVGSERAVPSGLWQAGVCYIFNSYTPSR